MRKWCDRYRCEGEAGLGDRSSRPRHSPRRTPEPQRQRVIELSRRTRRGAGFIAHVCDMHASTVHRICAQAGLGRLDRGDRSTGPPPKPLRYEREKPGELVHVDVKKLPAIPDGGGWRTHGRGNAGPRQRAGWRYVHSAIDDRTRLGYSEIHTNETGFTAAGFWRRAAAFYALAGIACERVLTDNGPCYRSKDFLTALKDTRTSPRRTRPYRPQTNGKVERFHRTLNEEWAYASDWDNDTQRSDALGIPPNRGDIVYEEALCHTHDASTTRSSGPVLCGSSGRREGRSLRSPAISGSVRAPSGTGSAKTESSGARPRA